MTNEQKKVVIQLYNNGLNISKINEKTNIDHKSIKKILQDANIKLRGRIGGQKRYSINETYFDKIDTEDKAYFLGMMYSDGYNYASKNLVRINLQVDDRDILEKLKSIIEYTGPIYDYQSKKKKKDGSGYMKTMSTLCFSSKNITQRLIKLGCPQNKSMILTCPEYDIIPKELYRHFIRGYIDGDGGITIGSNNHHEISITGATTFIPALAKKISELIDIDCYFYSEDNSKTSKIAIGNNNTIKVFLDFIYKNSSIYMNRKYNSYLEILTKITNHKNIVYFTKTMEKDIVNKITMQNISSGVVAKNYDVNISRICRVLKKYGFNSIKEIRKNLSLQKV